MIVFDIETNGLYKDATTIHVLSMYDSDNGMIMTFTGEDVRLGVSKLLKSNELVGHNILMFDLPVIEKLYPDLYSQFESRDDVSLRDTFLISQLLNPGIKGGHGLKAWGERLNNNKIDYTGGFDELNEDMITYCEQDVELTYVLYTYQLGMIKQIERFWDAYKTEADITPILFRQQQYGMYFDLAGAGSLVTALESRLAELKKEIKKDFPVVYTRGPMVVPERGSIYKVAGAPFNEVYFDDINIGSRSQILKRLEEKYNFKSPETTPKGNPSLSQDLLSRLEFPEAKKIYEYNEINKRLGQIKEGDRSWLNLVDNETSRIHGSMLQSGTVTRRFTHFNPNMTTIPASNKPYGVECRSLFRAAPGKVLVGIDAESLEMRCLAGYLHRFDKGKFQDLLLTGDPHSENARILECDRTTAKVWFYAMLYGAGAGKLRSIGPTVSKQEYMKRLGGLDNLTASLYTRYQVRGYITSLDGGKLDVRSEHSLLNTLLQSAGSIIMKKALKLFDDSLQSKGLIPGHDYEFVNNVHDEWQIETKPELAEQVGILGCEAITNAGKELNFPCPMRGEFKIGKTWANTH